MTEIAPLLDRLAEASPVPVAFASWLIALLTVAVACAYPFESASAEAVMLMTPVEAFDSATEASPTAVPPPMPTCAD